MQECGGGVERAPVARQAPQTRLACTQKRPADSSPAKILADGTLPTLLRKIDQSTQQMRLLRSASLLHVVPPPSVFGEERNSFEDKGCVQLLASGHVSLQPVGEGPQLAAVLIRRRHSGTGDEHAQLTWR